MALLEIIWNTNFFGVNCVNRWTYRASGTPIGVRNSTALGIAAGFLPEGEPPAYDPDKMMGVIQSTLSSGVAFVSVVVQDLYVLDDYITSAFPAGTVGSVPGAPMPPYVSYGYRTNRPTRAIRRATKRFVGVAEAATENNGTFNTETQGAMQAVAEIMSETLTYTAGGNTLSFAPIVVHKNKVTEGGKVKYKLYPTEAEQLAHIAEGISWEIYTQSRSQVSRQFGRGD